MAVCFCFNKNKPKLADLEFQRFCEKNLQKYTPNLKMYCTENTLSSMILLNYLMYFRKDSKPEVKYITVQIFKHPGQTV